MRHLFIVVLWLLSCTSFAVPWEDRQLFEGTSSTVTLRVISSTDTALFAPIIDGFVAQNPHVSVEYLVAGSSAIYQEFRQRPNDFDVLVSSAMDLQLKLVNDGFAHPINSISHPDWAQWRQSLFGFTLEPAAIVINKNAFATLTVPTSRHSLIQVLRANPDIFKGRVGTYDVRQSGLGYLFATQDARQSETYWRLMELMGGLEARLYCCSGEMIEELASGEIAVAYNVLGSYADARQDLADDIEVILPADFPTIMMRTAMVSASSATPDAATRFVQYLVSSQWNRTNSGTAPLPSLSAAYDTDTQNTPIALEPGLLIFLDQMKRRIFIEEWESAIIQ